MNRDEGSYQLSHTYDGFLDTTAGHRLKILPMKAYEGDRNVKRF